MFVVERLGCSSLRAREGQWAGLAMVLAVLVSSCGIRETVNTRSSYHGNSGEGLSTGWEPHDCLDTLTFRLHNYRECWYTSLCSI